MSFWKTSTGAKLESQGSFNVGGGEMAPIPSGTKVKAMITEIKFELPSDRDAANGFGEELIKVRWDVVDGEFKNRVIFQKIAVDHEKVEKKDKALEMLAAIDFNAGGKLMASGEKPSDHGMAKALTNVPMILQLQVWETKKDDGSDMSGNWVQAVYNATQMKADAPKPKEDKPDFDSFDDDIPF